MSIYKKNLGILSSINQDINVGYVDNSLLIDSRYLNYLRYNYNFIKLYNIIKNSFLKALIVYELNNINYNKLIISSLDGLLILSNNNIYTVEEQTRFKNLNITILTQFNKIKEIKEIKEHVKINIPNNETLNTSVDASNSNIFYKYLSKCYNYIKQKLIALKQFMFN